ncbi:hypothetical protein RAS_01470 [Rickettsia asiatica]|uniref:Uncharacterized protein n=1 Tax=Rickettsia asiatica TaxID=238800 RepID=A0A510G698_9RICK|nr:hypothetical protein RAS_01470 [Rickettsia asiatica]
MRLPRSLFGINADKPPRNDVSKLLNKFTHVSADYPITIFSFRYLFYSVAKVFILTKTSMFR